MTNDATDDKLAFCSKTSAKSKDYKKKREKKIILKHRVRGVPNYKVRT